MDSDTLIKMTTLSDQSEPTTKKFGYIRLPANPYSFHLLNKATCNSIGHLLLIKRF